MKFIKKIRDETKQFASKNIIEILIAIGAIFIFAGLYMIFKPVAYIALGLIILFLAFVIYKN